MDLIAEPVEVAPPAGCPSGLIDLPLPPDANVDHSQPGYMTYTTVTAPADVASFYDTQLPAAGWLRTAMGPNVGGGWVVSFTRADEEATVIVASLESGSDVVLLVDRRPI